MAENTSEFSLRAILFADLAGYSRMVSRDETGTLDFMEQAFGVFGSFATEYGGALVKTTGDGVVVEFTSASQSVRYAVRVQERLKQLSEEAGSDRLFRIGIHLGEVKRTDTDIYGHAVNIAARLEAQARPGGICVSHEVYQHARRDGDLGFVSEGVAALKNIPDAISTYHVSDLTGEPDDGFSEGIDVTTIDGLEIADADGVPATVRSDRVRAMLGYLALKPDLSESVDRMCALLWPDKTPASARRSLSGCVRVAKGIVDGFAPGTLYRRGNRVGLDPSRTDVDLVNALKQVSVGAVNDMLVERPDWPEAILYGSEDISSLYRSWLLVNRQNWRTRLIENLEACLLRHDAPELAARRAALAVLVLEPSHEKALQKLVQHHAETGNVALAVKVYKEFAELLDKTYGITPSAETVELVDSFSRQKPALPVAPAEPRVVTRRPSIAVGDFDAEGADPVNIHLVAGFRSEIIANLSRFRDWVVIEADDAGSGESERPDYVMSARCDAGHSELTISVVLKDPASNRVIWSNRFEITLENWFEAQRLMVRRIAAHTEIYLSSDRLAQVMGADRMNASDYNDWLRGEHLLSLWTRQGEDEAEEIFSAIVERSPEFAPAYASLASIYNVRHLIRPGSPLDAADSGKAFPLAMKAVELDALDARNHLTVAWSSAMNGRYEQAAVHYELATNLNGSSPKALISCAQGLAFVGAADKARSLLNEAFELAPFFLPYQWCYIASTNYMTGDYEAAVSAARRGGHATKDNPAWCAASLARLGRLGEAREAFAEELTLLRGDWAGGGEPDADDVVTWFTGAFPIGLAADRQVLGQTMNEVVAGM